jgi:hypothetical protein
MAKARKETAAAVDGAGQVPGGRPRALRVVNDERAVRVLRRLPHDLSGEVDIDAAVGVETGEVVLFALGASVPGAAVHRELDRGEFGLGLR